MTSLDSSPRGAVASHSKSTGFQPRFVPHVPLRGGTALHHIATALAVRIKPRAAGMEVLLTTLTDQVIALLPDQLPP